MKVTEEEQKEFDLDMERQDSQAEEIKTQIEDKERKNNEQIVKDQLKSKVDSFDAMSANFEEL